MMAIYPVVAKLSSTSTVPGITIPIARKAVGYLLSSISMVEGLHWGALPMMVVGPGASCKKSAPWWSAWHTVEAPNILSQLPWMMGVDALQYLSSHAAELGLDASRIILSGFSAGGNLAVTVPLRLRERLVREVYPYPTATTSTSNLSQAESTKRLVDNSSDLQIVGLFCWYPILDFEEPRDHRRARSIFPDKTLPAFFTTLFDDAYLPDHEDRKSPYASPVRAPNEILADALPHDIFLYICEWDMLLNEGQHFVLRLQDLGKRVRAMMIEKACHAWDKSPNPFRDQNKVNVLYRDACADMKAIFEH